MKTHAQEHVSESAADARGHLAAALDSGKEICSTVRDQVLAEAGIADQAVRNHTYEAIGITFVLGGVLGFLIGRRR